MAVKLDALGELPNPPDPVKGAAYLPVIRPPGDAVPICPSGQLPIDRYFGMRYGHDLSQEDAQDAAKGAMLFALAQLKTQMKEGETLWGAQVLVTIACDDDIGDHALVANGATQFLIDAGVKVARAAIGVSSLPLKSPVEVWTTFWVLPCSVPDR